MLRAILLFAAIALSTQAMAITAQSYVVMDLYGKVLLQKNSFDERPIASITKIFVAEEALKQDQNELITITRADVQNGRMRSSPLKAGASYTRRQLIELALVSSDNIAALALARSYQLQPAEATLVEGSGLDPRNRASAYQIARATLKLYDTEVGAISVKTNAEVGNRRSTNPLLTQEGWTFLLSKTGFIRAAGGCLTTVVFVRGEPLIITILGARDTRQRWADLAELRRQLGDTNFYVPVKVTKVTKKSKR